MMETTPNEDQNSNNNNTNETTGTTTPDLRQSKSKNVSTCSEEWQVVENPNENDHQVHQVHQTNRSDMETKPSDEEDTVQVVTLAVTVDDTTNTTVSTSTMNEMTYGQTTTKEDASRHSNDNVDVDLAEAQQQQQEGSPKIMSLQASYQDIAEAKRKKEETARLELEIKAEEERLAKEAERLQSIERLEQERRQLRLEEERKAREHLQQQGQEQHLLQQQQQLQQQQPNELSEKSTTPEQSSSPKSMVVLVSKSFGTVAQRTNQDRAITTLKGQGILFDEVDGSDPTLKDLRNDLFAISGIRGSYPQFFVKQGNQITFLGDFEAFEYMNESGTLSQTFAVEKTAPTAVPVPVDPVIVDNTQPSGKSIIVLVSKSFGTMAQRTSQDRAITTLSAKGIPFEEVDGSDPLLKDRRTELFEISGLRGKYPQFFVQEGDQINFLGDFEAFESMNDDGRLDASLLAETDIQPKEIETTNEANTSSLVNKIMIILISKSFGSTSQKTNQDRASSILSANKIPFEEVDGSDPSLKVLRDALFGISGIRGNYPQFFIKEEDRFTFIGGFETLDAMNDAGTLGELFVVEPAKRKNTPPPSHSLDPHEAMPPYSKKMIVLVSKSFGTIAQKTKQDRARTMLTSKQIPFEEVDGSDPNLKDRRNELFEISGVRGNYPQFFIATIDQTTFLGDFEVLETMNETGKLTFALLVTPPDASDDSTEQLRALAPDRTANRTVSFDSMPEEVWENEFDSTPPLEQHGRTMSRDSVVIPSEVFENEFDEDDAGTYPQLINSSTLRSASKDSLRVPSETFDNEFDDNMEPRVIVRAKLSRVNSEDSDMIPGESFENEYEPAAGSSSSKRRSGRKTPDEVFENEFEPIDEEEPGNDEGKRLLLENENDSDSDSEKHSTNMSPTYLHLSMGVLGVAVIIGIWLSGQRGSHSH